MKKYPYWICLILALSSGIFAGWVDFNNDEPQAAVLVILVVTFLLGLIQPRLAWLWAIIVALSLPAVYLVATNVGFQPVSPPSPGLYATLLALIPSFIGAYAGALCRMIMNKVIAAS